MGKVTEINGLFLMPIKYLNENLITFIEFNGELEIVAMVGYSEMTNGDERRDVGSLGVIGKGVCHTPRYHSHQRPCINKRIDASETRFGNQILHTPALKSR